MCARKDWLLKLPGRIIPLICTAVLYLGPVRGQTYNFAHYDIDNGLIQSQVVTIYQDPQHYLWFGSYGGLNRFDGKEFKSYSKSDGLSRSMVTSILRDRSGKIWLGSENGVISLYRNKISNIPLPKEVMKKLVRNMVEDATGGILMTSNSRLLRLKDGKVSPYVITADGEFVTALCKSPLGVIHAAVYGQGIFAYNGKSWKRVVAASDGVPVYRIVFDRQDPRKLFLLSPKDVLVAVGGKATPLFSGSNTIEGPFNAMEQDAEGNLWIGTNNGAYWLKPGATVHFNAANGFTNYPVLDIFRDSEDNMWLGTNGAGVFRFDGGLSMSYHYINKSGSLPMAMETDAQGQLWMSTNSASLVRFNGQEFIQESVPAVSFYSKNVLCLHRSGNTLYAGSLDGLWKHGPGGFTNILKDQYPKTVRAMLTDSHGTLWMGAPKGCFYLDKGKSIHIDDLNYPVEDFVEAGKDSILVATSNGLYLLKDKKLDRSFHVRGIENATVMCMVNYRGTILAGTFGDGLMLIDVKGRRVSFATSKQGFYSNDIYSLAADDYGYVWAGTGKGVNRFLVDPSRLTVNMRTEDVLPYTLFECNQNAMVNADGKMWVGTTKGLYVYETRMKDRSRRKPYINIQTVSIVSQSPGAATRVQSYEDVIPDTLNLTYRQNRIMISFAGIYMTDPDNVSYQYRLRGQGEKFVPPVKLNIIEFPALLPGTYTFEVKAVSASGVSSATRSITFIITPPYYQTVFFRIFVILLLIALVIGIQYYWNYLKAQRKRALAKMKLEEQERIRQETAEDFHDDIGNKLTRIAVLSDMLNRYIPEEQTEQKDLVKQIKGNADTLYRGTKDILWALDPQSDNIEEILSYTCKLGNEIFYTNDIRFSCKTEGSQLHRKLPMKYSRNISMLLKECSHNILKHAEAKHVDLSATCDKDRIRIVVQDDGKGFDPAMRTSGRGLNNMRVRAKRLNAGLEIRSLVGAGSTIVLEIPLIEFKEEL